MDRLAIPESTRTRSPLSIGPKIMTGTQFRSILGRLSWHSRSPKEKTRARNRQVRTNTERPRHFNVATTHTHTHRYSPLYQALRPSITNSQHHRPSSPISAISPCIPATLLQPEQPKPEQKQKLDYDRIYAFTQQVSTNSSPLLPLHSIPP